MKNLYKLPARIDHIAIAVMDLEEALFLYQGLLGFELVQKREIKGEFSGMHSAELSAHGFNIVLIQGVDENSQVSQYVKQYGPGVQHIAIEVEDMDKLVSTLENKGMEFATKIINGKNLMQIFTKRNPNCGMMIEFIKKQQIDSRFEKNNIQDLFQQLEASGAY
ncbi:VOC family protein [Pseudoalteromonas sp. SMS1]|uniref:VOC family protein n=1 Tax=Pseudoalteromonas sp. SMS1 TaxID=2908894 RepID=UPI001F3B36A6|nr:VOC family protein [Pseudoalteromonas sp. SMS1]MCF2857591.1 VOC family protein [Pseudoalteromonas sp. SMS1]